MPAYVSVKAGHVRRRYQAATRSSAACEVCHTFDNQRSPDVGSLLTPAEQQLVVTAVVLTTPVRIAVEKLHNLTEPEDPIMPLAAPPNQPKHDTCLHMQRQLTSL